MLKILPECLDGVEIALRQGVKPGRGCAKGVHQGHLDKLIVLWACRYEATRLGPKHQHLWPIQQVIGQGRGEMIQINERLKLSIKARQRTEAFPIGKDPKLSRRL